MRKEKRYDPDHLLSCIWSHGLTTFEILKSGTTTRLRATRKSLLFQPRLSIYNPTSSPHWGNRVTADRNL